MKCTEYTVIARSVQDTGTAFVAHTSEGDTLRIVRRGNGYRIRRISNKTSWKWDLSFDSYNTPEEAKEALMSGKVKFVIGG